MVLMFLFSVRQVDLTLLRRADLFRIEAELVLPLGRAAESGFFLVIFADRYEPPQREQSCELAEDRSDMVIQDSDRRRTASSFSGGQKIVLDGRGEGVHAK